MAGVKKGLFSSIGGFQGKKDFEPIPIYRGEKMERNPSHTSNENLFVYLDEPNSEQMVDRMGKERVISKEDGVEITEGEHGGSWRYLKRDEKGDIVGVIQGVTMPDGVPVLSNLYVRPDYRGKGVAQELSMRLRKDKPNIHSTPSKSQDAIKFGGYTDDYFKALPIAATGLFTGALMAPSESEAIFAGKLAKTADLKALKKAEDMLSKGVDPEETYQATGWFKGADGEWRFEIDDSQSRGLERSEWGWGNSEDWKQGNPVAGAVNEFFEHPELDNAYGGIFDFGDDGRQATMRIHRGSESGSYDPERQSISTSAIEDLEGNVRPDRSVVGHELQHLVQRREGFAQGGSPEAMAEPIGQAKARWSFLEGEQKKLVEQMDELESNYELPTPQKKAALSDLKNQYQDVVDEKMSIYDLAQADAFKNYKSLAGEAEARLVQQRIPLNAEERRAYYPMRHLEDMLGREGIKPEELIVRMGEGPMMGIQPLLKFTGRAK